MNLVGSKYKTRILDSNVFNNKLFKRWDQRSQLKSLQKTRHHKTQKLKKFFNEPLVLKKDCKSMLSIFFWDDNCKCFFQSISEAPDGNTSYLRFFLGDLLHICVFYPMFFMENLLHICVFYPRFLAGPLDRRLKSLLDGFSKIKFQIGNDTCHEFNKIKEIFIN